MVKGKSTCKLLKDIRQQIADANGISYQPKECHHKGDCAVTVIGNNRNIIDKMISGFFILSFFY